MRSGLSKDRVDEIIRTADRQFSIPDDPSEFRYKFDDGTIYPFVLCGGTLYYKDKELVLKYNTGCWVETDCGAEWRDGYLYIYFPKVKITRCEEIE